MSLQEKKKFSFDVSWVFIASTVVLLFHFIQNPLIARYIGPEGLGLFSIVFVIITFTGLVAGLGIDTAVVKFVAEFKEDKSKLQAILSTSVILVTILGLIATVILFILSENISNIFKNPSLSPVIKIFSFILPFYLVYGVIVSYFNGLREMKQYAIMNVSYKIIIFLLIISFLYFGFGMNGVITGNIIATIIMVFIGMASIRKIIYFEISQFINNVKKILTFGTQLMLGNAINNITNYQADTLLVAYFLSATDVGYYSVAIAFSRFFWRIPQSIQIISFPTVSEYWAKGKISSLTTMMNKSIKYSICLLLPLGLGLWFFSDIIIVSLYGDEFINSIFPLQILLIGTVINGSLSRPMDGMLASAGYQRLELLKIIIAATSTILLNIYLIPRYGLLGAAAASTISLSLSTFIALFLIIRTLNLKIDLILIMKTFGFAIVILFINIFFNTSNNYILHLLCLLLYILFIIKLILSKEDKELSKELIGSFIRKFSIIAKLKLHFSKI